MANRDLDIQAGKTVPLIMDFAGGQLNLFPGFSTGLGKAVVSIKKSGVALSSNNVVNNFVDGFIVGGFKILIENVFVAILSITVQNNTTNSVIICYTVEVFDGTNLQTKTGIEAYTVLNKGGVVTTVHNGIGGIISGQTGGGLTVSFQLSSANPSVFDIKADSSLVPVTGFPRVNYSVLNLSNQAITLL